MLQEIGALQVITQKDVFDDATYRTRRLGLATGETHTVKEFAKLAFSELGLNWEDYVVTSDKYSRPNEVHHLLGDASKAKKDLNWKLETSFKELVKLMVESDLELAEKEKF